MSARRLGLIGVGLVLLVVCIFFAEENWRGRRAWESCRSELEAKGALNWQAFIPPPVPDEQNFAVTPFLAPLFDFNPRPRAPGQQPWRDVDGHSRAANFATALLPKNSKGSLPPANFSGALTDLEVALVLLGTESNQPPTFVTQQRPRAETATAALAALQGFEPVLSELRSASQRPYCRFNIEYDAEDPMTILLPHYLVLQRVTRVLEVRASAELELGKADAAFEDVTLMHFLADSTEKEPFIVGMSARANRMKRTEQIIWEGLAGRSWSESQLRQFQVWFENYKPFKELERCLRAERAAFGGATFRYLRGHKNELRLWLGADEVRPLAYLLAGPDGWLYQEQVSYHRLYDQVLTGFDPDSGYIRPDGIDRKREAMQRELNRSIVWHHTGFCRLVFTNVMQTFQRAAIAQNRANQTVVACALERYHVSASRYPESLNALVPRFIDELPLDVCDGHPQKYRRLNDNRFLLYGVGWNETDENGAVIANADGSDIEPNRGDWVWPRYPEK
jgi:hypothetical protein